MTEEAEQLKEQIGNDKKLPDVDPKAKFLKPPPPIQQAESNWPLLTVSRVSFLSMSIIRASGSKNVEGIFGNFPFAHF